jgi:hypothetical protein
VHLFAFILRDKLLKISLLNHQRFHTFIAPQWSLWSSWSQSSVSFLLIMFENWTKSTVIKTFSSNSLDHGFNVKSQLKFPFDGFNESALGDGSAFIEMTSQRNKSVDYSKWKDYDIHYLKQNQFCYFIIFPSWFGQHNWGVHSCQALGFTFGRCLC